MLILGLELTAFGLEPLGQGLAWTGSLLLTGVLLVATLVGRWQPRKRRKLRRVVLPFTLWLVLAAFTGVSHWTGWQSGVAAGALLARIIRDLVLINLGGILVFDLLLPLLQMGVDNIVADLALGLAYVVAGIVLLRQGGVNLSGIVATSAVLTAVLGLSLQATLGNILGGVALQLDDSVRVGDWLQLENGRQGKVMAIRWRHTVVETRDWDTIIVPNASLLSQNLTLLGKRGDQPLQHRMWIYFNVDYHHAPANVTAVVEAALRDTPLENVAADPAPQCLCYDFGKDGHGSSVTYAIRYWLTDLAKDDPTSAMVRLRALAALKRAGLALAIPATGVVLAKEDSDHARELEGRELQRRIAALDAVELFNPMTREEKAVMAEQVRPAPFTRGEIITHQGAQAHRLYILTQGRVEVRYRSERGEEVPVSTIQTPGIFGELGMMTGATRSSSVVALEEVECLCFEKADFERFIHQRPEIAYSMSKVLAERQVGLQARRENLDVAERTRRVESRHREILGEIRGFFGLEGEV
jgi:small-conductance mechanosensitive channel/CRP-like cAMP-binding protein